MIAGTRNINYLRISVTDRCNFRCRYCVPAGPFKVIEHESIARYEEILRIVGIGCDMGITKVRITGGEPFVRKGIFSFLHQLCRISQLKDISITTNGSRLNRDKIKELMDMGIQRLNFSLDTLVPGKFIQITQRDRFQRVWDSIMAAHDLGMSPIKINTVALKGFNDDEIQAIAGLTREYPFHVRFIEYMPMGNTDLGAGRQILTRDIKNLIIDAHGSFTSVPKRANDGPAKLYKLAGASGILGFITPVSSHFCSECNRLRLTSRGTLRPCLLSNNETDILTPLRNGADDEALKQIMVTALKDKPLHHNLEKRTARDMPLNHMTSIGG
ncbi:GTP 3',8-cyclase MoaA [Desulfobacter hydrogenophilus]|uniref:GTP 3',8-cyclase n=1 Tax=Desulfobacter hydrogenophilus TaxID=2291 RepID=A0A328FFF6_9BACT|nr:GTP 3',8-cyclase MoaA [Desulfobacter hydrogenophilus]NDY72362.1 GTP 3',8-cyclase MoaA [Desulfobacter hydrogenophilus]QBH15558.1 GTP 3',8-cyclase MoaA [Desulfobacter hydrogenophilus]RAM01795.1 GTP 3',8-cyclase MoaA [Desulfobacter hydrogenophilus]